MSTLLHVSIVYTIAGPKIAVNNFDFESNNSLTLIEVVEASLAGAAGWSGTPNLRSIISSSHSLARVEAYSYDLVANPTGPPAFKRFITLGPVNSTSLTPSGLDSSADSPQVAVCASFTGVQTGRTKRGRIYLPSPEQGVCSAAGTVNPTYRTDADAALTAWITGVENSPDSPQTLTHSVVSLTTAEVTEVTSVEVRQRADTQRRRLRRGIDVN